jgi:hypothetical protein
MFASLQVAGGAAMADVSAETVLDAAVVSVALLSFFAHAVSASDTMASVATLDPDPFINILLLPSPSQGSRKKPH